MNRRKAKSWLKNKGYLHITNRIDIRLEKSKILNLVRNPKLVCKHSFFPLIYKTIPQRRFKIIGYNKNGKPIRGHKKKNNQGYFVSTKKNRRIHYATHVDAHILSYYSSQILGKKYEHYLASNKYLTESIIAYRKISIEGTNSNKNNIHFAKEVFDFIKKHPTSTAMAFDIENFFPTLNHSHLKRAWCQILGTKSLPPDHYNIFKNITNYSYIELDQFRNNIGSFDEKRLAKIRKFGTSAFYKSPQEFRKAVGDGELRIRKNQYHDEMNKLCGIPQGLAISAMLANIYLLEFDEAISKVVYEKKGLYRRYSDDIAIVCDTKYWENIESIVIKEIKKYKLKISQDKTEICRFNLKSDNSHLESTLIIRSKNGLIEKKSVPFRYLGFEFNGKNILIKSKNISKFYRRLKYAIKTKSKRIEKAYDKDPLATRVVFKRKLRRSFTSSGAKSRLLKRKIKILEKNKHYGHYEFTFHEIESRYWGNFIGYAKRASEIMEEPKILSQIRNHNKILKNQIKKIIKK